PVKAPRGRARPLRAPAGPGLPDALDRSIGAMPPLAPVAPLAPVPAEHLPLQLAPPPAHGPGYPAVIRVFATSQTPDFDGPWQARTPTSSTGSAVVIGPSMLLTGAHVVAN